MDINTKLQEFQRSMGCLQDRVPKIPIIWLKVVEKWKNERFFDGFGP